MLKKKQIESEDKKSFLASDFLSDGACWKKK